MNAIKQVHARNIERHARRLIARRIGHTPSAIIAVARDESRPDCVILHVNSGGNAREAESELKRRGYGVEPTNYDPFGTGNYGVRLRVSPKHQRRQRRRATESQ
ncbi:hypothetical protein B5P44_00520 [Mycobacterium sp. CBMA 213]|uniref:Uncharacterized protein n=1 Tax=Mycolicibacterium sp. CBMA 213 TaxID=1968788 RepID=A0A343VR87_9MYCO|nr:hypothetical protein B5P44_p00116 [Mycolicibacterium sp. CBMA 213]MUL61069.1 hypothetical protein [Mycolicibacterium sp. CBMA 335]MUM03307.1 hypothetical protein [Mycolicibacterium sp. CBMA 213]